VRNAAGVVVECWVGGTRLAPEAVVADEMAALYAAGPGGVIPDPA
jgi:hypothetical protein